MLLKTKYVIYIMAIPNAQYKVLNTLQTIYLYFNLSQPERAYWSLVLQLEAVINIVPTVNSKAMK